MKSTKKRCICGRSKITPLCDGSHRDEGWQCSAVTETPVELAFLGGPHLVNLADRLAHRFEGVSLNAISGTLHAAELVVLTDGSDIQWLRHRIASVDAQTTRVVGIGVALPALQWAFPEHQCVTVPDDTPTMLWKQVETAVQAQPVLPGEGGEARPKVFLSHAVADEGRLFPVLNRLREQYKLELFVCADSIPVGDAWQEEIRHQLSSCDQFLLISSPAVLSSVYCAFEVGMATALEKPIRVISLEEGATPPYVSHLQVMCVERLLLRKPWLLPDEGLLDAILDVLLSTPKAPA